MPIIRGATRSLFIKCHHLYKDQGPQAPTLTSSLTSPLVADAIPPLHVADFFLCLQQIANLCFSDSPDFHRAPDPNAVAKLIKHMVAAPKTTGGATSTEEWVNLHVRGDIFRIPVSKIMAWPQGFLARSLAQRYPDRFPSLAATAATVEGSSNMSAVVNLSDTAALGGMCRWDIDIVFARICVGVNQAIKPEKRTNVLSCFSLRVLQRVRVPE
jgi:hypothetical protein